MSILIDIPPAIVQEVQIYAESRGLTVNGLVRTYLSELVGKKRTPCLMGAAAKYARPDRRELEKTAFRKAMENRHAPVR